MTPEDIGGFLVVVFLVATVILGVWQWYDVIVWCCNHVSIDWSW